ncbi:DUF4309 domain-containing protein [Brevibacillus ginsengisoli]|uniref:DUF4309 domain-containing protein n=1 Tax=Brevibacillus ginsengisoli TaxID=363854 RepID=UPI003CF11843
MKRIIAGTVLSVLVMSGCIPSSTTSTEPTQHVITANSSTGNESVKTENKSDTTQKEQNKPEEKIKESKIILDHNFLPLLASGEIQGFDISIGANKEDVLKKYGAVTEEDYYEGGKYSKLEKLNNGIVFFDDKNRVYAIDLAASSLDKTNLEEIKKALGSPVSEGVSDIDDSYCLTYETGNVTVNLSSKDNKSPVETISIINKNL